MNCVDSWFERCAHFRIDNETSIKLGKKVADIVIQGAKNDKHPYIFGLEAGLFIPISMNHNNTIYTVIFFFVNSIEVLLKY